MKQLNLTEKDIRRDWEEAVARNHEVPHHASPWLKKAKEMDEKAQSIPMGGIGCFNMIKRYRAGRESYKILEEIESLEERKSEIKFTNRQRPLAEVVIPKLEKLDIFVMVNLKQIWSSLTKYITVGSREKINATLKREISEMDDYVPANVTYPSNLLHTCHHLQHLELRNDERVEEVVFEMDSQRPLLLPYLKVLELYDLKEMRHVWKCNWNKFFIPQHHPLHFPFQNLTDITLWDCHKIKYLFSPLMAKFLSNLKHVYIGECDGIEEVVSWRDDEYEENTLTSFQKNTTFFPCLETLELHSLKLLNRVDGGDTRSRSDTICSNITNTNHDQSSQVIGAFWSLCQYPRNIYTNGCDALSRLVPWYAVRQMNRLEHLMVMNCETMMEVFESESNVDEGSAHVSTSLTLKNITIVVPQLSNLKHVYIESCDLLSHVFTFSTLESLKQLKELKVKECKAIQVIVKEENGMSSENVVFPRLETLVLDDLPSLKGFFLGMNEFRWPLLDDVMINDCPQLMMFTSGESKTPKLKYIRTSLGKHSLECGLNFHGMIKELQITFPSSYDPTITKGIPCSFHNLVEIEQSNKYVETILPSIKSSNEVFEGSDFNESQTIVQIPNLTQVKLIWLYCLKYLWKSNQWMVLEFPNLTNVSISNCHSLEHVFTCSMVGSLVQLQDLSITYCNKIVVIVKNEEECDVKVNEILLPRLKSLKLNGLQSLKGFCLGKEDFSWPSLDTLEMRDCSAVTVFTNGYLFTPELKVIDTRFGKYYVKPDLNSFIKTKQVEGYEF
ncbi:hypothetical protein L1987_88057 [Smallanthus sonchifolius]|nr:hypothetical protein L1987_88053 [Smallanthus sonchifolius]KAI3670238.1 hypothetical protein L1987_88057 [Smallanthus sonchifolius]